MLCEICGAEAWYVCGKSGRPVCSEHSRIEIVSKTSFGTSPGLSVREAEASDYDKIGELAEYFRSGTKVTRFGKEYDILTLPAYVVSSNSHIAGVLSYSLEDDAMVLALLSVLPGYQGLGAGKMLVEAAKDRALREGRKTILTSTSNDDFPSLYFYQRNGFQIYEVATNLIAEKHGELKCGFSGLPSRDEVRLRWDADYSQG